MQYLIVILYLLDLQSDSVNTVMELLVFPLLVPFQFMTILLPITLAIERMIVIGFPYRHRSIMTKKTVFSILAVMWGISLILTIASAIIVPVNIVWPLALVDFDNIIAPLIALPRLMSAVFITVANVFLQYKVAVSNRKAKENERLGNEEEKQLQKLTKLLRAQVKPTTTLFLVGGIDVIVNMLISFIHATIVNPVQSSTRIYLKKFLMYPMFTSLLVIHPLVYGLYMKKIRDRLLKCTVCQGQWNTRNSKVTRLTTLHQQLLATKM